MLQSKQRLLELNAKLAETLSSKGVTATADETTTALVNKVADISGGGVDYMALNVEGTLTDYNIPNGVANIRNYCLVNYSNLKSIYIPDTVKSIGISAFASTKIETIKIPNGVETIGNTCFSSCTTLREIKLPSSLITLAQTSLNGCKKLEYVYVDAGFNVSLNLSVSQSENISRDIIRGIIDNYADRTGQSALILTVGSSNIEKLTEEDIAVATSKNITLA